MLSLSDGEVAVDFVVLSRSSDPLDERVLNGITHQVGIDVRLHRVSGVPRATDRTRWDTIARARNVGRTLGNTEWIMFVDDDVVLEKSCVSQLLSELESRQELSAIGADYLSERNRNGLSPHVAMGATLFRRRVFSQLGFRAEQKSCECQCMADDLRRLSMEIDYSPTATATHLRESRSSDSHTRPCGCTDACRDFADEPSPREPAILTAFNRSHMGLFTRRFLGSLRRWHNQDVMVHAVTYGLRKKDIRRIEGLANVRCYPLPYTTELICKARMRGFQIPLKSLCPKTPVAYWDAGDVVFQCSLEPLWKAVRDTPKKLLVTEEPPPWSKNPGHKAWINHIHDRQHRASVLSLLGGNPIVNGGFVAGLAGRLKAYFDEATRLSDGPLFGAGGGADQVTLNFCKYRSPDEFQVVDDTWNYCLLGRSGRDCKIRNGQYFKVPSGQLVAVVHGNSQSLSS